MSAALIRELPHVQRLALSYARRGSRAQTLAVFALDVRLGGIVRARREPMLAQLRLAWWRDSLVRPREQWPQGDAVLDALREWRDPSGLRSLVSAWEALLVDELGPTDIAQFADGRAAAFSCLAAELGVRDLDRIARAARTFALADLAANMRAGPERDSVIDLGRAQPAVQRLPPALRPLAVLAGLSRSALVRGGMPLLTGPRSMLLALRIGLSGR